MSPRLSWSGALLLLLVGAVPLTAQAPRFSISAGPAVPMAGLPDVTHNNGFSVQAGVGIGKLSGPFSLRIDGLFSSFGGKAVPGYPERKYSDHHFLGLTGNVAYTLETPSVRPYAIAGLGYYNDDPGMHNVGLNAGVGVRFPMGRISPFAEARFHNVATLGGSDYGSSSPTRTGSLSVGVSF